MKICLITNLAPHYREEIFRLIDARLECDFMFGDTLHNGIRTFSPVGFRNAVTVLKNVQKGQVTLWQRGVMKALGKPYGLYILSGDIRCFSTWVFLMLACVLRKRVWLWAHGWSGRENAMQKFLKKLFFRMPEGVLLYGDYARNLMIDNGFSADRLWVIHNSLAYSRQVQIRKHLSMPNIFSEKFGNTDPTLIFIGRLTASKRLDMILDAMTLLSERQIFCNLILVGEGPESETLKRRAIVSGLGGRIWFYGACYDETINAELISNADLCVSPGNIGLTAIHVMTYGTPAITHNCFKYQGPEFEAIQPGVTGDFYDYGSVKSLALRIELWLTGKSGDRDKVRKACYAEIARSWTPEYQLSVIMKHL